MRLRTARNSSSNHRDQNQARQHIGKAEIREPSGEGMPLDTKRKVERDYEIGQKNAERHEHRFCFRLQGHTLRILRELKLHSVDDPALYSLDGNKNSRPLIGNGRGGVEMLSAGHMHERLVSKEIVRAFDVGFGEARALR